MVNDLDPRTGRRDRRRRSANKALAIPGDITAPSFPQYLVDRTFAERGAIDIVVNNAGYTWDNVIQKTTDDQFQAMLDIHVTAPFPPYCARPPVTFVKPPNAKRPRASA